MGEYLSMYLAENDSEVSEEGALTNPVQLNLRTDLNEEKEI